MKENLLLVKDSLELSKIKFINIWLQYREMPIDKIDKLDDTVNKYNNTYCSTIKLKPVNVKPNWL